MKSLSKFILSIIFLSVCLGAHAQEVMTDSRQTADSTDAVLPTAELLYDLYVSDDSTDYYSSTDSLEYEPEIEVLSADTVIYSPEIDDKVCEFITEECGPAVDSTSVNWRRSQRGLIDVNNMFVPRGQWIFGGTASYSTQTNDSYTFLVFEDIGSDGYTFKVSPMVAYAVKDNMAFGARIAYSRSLTKIDSGEINLGDEESGTHIKADYYYSLKHSYSLSGIWRQYIPLGSNKRFAIYNETSVTVGAHQKKFAANDPVRGTYETGYSVSLDISPGLIAFITNTAAVEVNIGVMGLNYSSTQQTHNRVYTGRITSSGLNFNINLLAIGLGMSFYL